MCPHLNCTRGPPARNQFCLGPSCCLPAATAACILRARCLVAAGTLRQTPPRVILSHSESPTKRWRRGRAEGGRRRRHHAAGATRGSSRWDTRFGGSRAPTPPDCCRALVALNHPTFRMTPGYPTSSHSHAGSPEATRSHPNERQRRSHDERRLRRSHKAKRGPTSHALQRRSGA